MCCGLRLRRGPSGHGLLCMALRAAETHARASPALPGEACNAGDAAMQAMQALLGLAGDAGGAWWGVVYVCGVCCGGQCLFESSYPLAMPGPRALFLGSPGGAIPLPGRRRVRTGRCGMWGIHMPAA